MSVVQCFIHGSNVEHSLIDIMLHRRNKDLVICQHHNHCTHYHKIMYEKNKVDLDSYPLRIYIFQKPLRACLKNLNILGFRKTL